MRQGFSWKGQSAIEYLMTYGWMLLVVAIVGGLIFTLIQDQDVEENQVDGFMDEQVTIERFSPSSDGLQMQVRNAEPEDITITKINIKGNNNETTSKLANRIDFADKETLTLENVSQSSDTQEAEVEITYETEDGLAKTAQGTITGNLKINESKTGSSGPTATQVYSTSTSSDWKTGTFSRTTVDKPDSLGDLEIGYRNESTDLEAYYRLDGGSGDVTDYSGNGNTGTNNGANEGASGVFGTNAFNFDGSDDYIEVSKDSSYVFDGSNDKFSVMGWIKPYTVSGASGHVIGGVYDSSEDNQMLTFSIRNGNLRVVTYNSGNLVDDESALSVSTNEWHFAAVSYDMENDNGILYLDGQTHTFTASANGLSNVNEEWRWGMRIGSNSGNPDPSAFFDGKMDEMQIRSTALSKSGFDNLYFQGHSNDFNGTYDGGKIDRSSVQDWHRLEVNASSIDSDVDLSANFTALNSTGGFVDDQTININKNNPENYTLTVQDSEDAKVSFNGTSSNITKTWSISNYQVFAK